MSCDKHETEYWEENNSVGNNDIESQKNLACFQIYRTDVQVAVTLFKRMF